MTDDPFLRGHGLFREAQKLPESERQAFLESRRAGDPKAVEIACRELQGMAEPTGSFPSLVELPPAMKTRPLGSQVAGWRLTEFLGEGGYGRVYRAVRTTRHIREEGAIKFLDKRPAEGGRFQRERQLLANFIHPGIPRFIDAGTDDDGIPFVVMEYVSGLPITDHCDVNGLSINERLQFFIELCRVMEYAHRTIFHRDLKPENILVTPQGVVRVLDLGLAGILDPRDEEESLTGPGGPGFSQYYASPEQVQGKRPSATADIYSLGAVLYKLITGMEPLRLAGADWKDELFYQNPLPPSQTLLLGKEAPVPRRGSSGPETGIYVRGGTESKLRRECGGDLDAIVLKALKKDPGSRYGSVEEFREDIERFLSGLQVQARPSGIAERIRKWSGKNRGTALLLAASSLLIIGVAHFAALRYVDYNTRVVDQDAAERRILFLAEAALPEIGKSLPEGAASSEARASLARIQSDLLVRIEGLPETARQRLDHALIVSALDCATRWSALGDPAAAMDTLTPAVGRAALRHQGYPQDALWRRLYGQVLNERIALRVRLGHAGESAEDAKALAALKWGAR